MHCAVPTCSNGAHTTLSGTVYDPAGKNPLYNVVVFVPNDPAGKLAPIKTGTNSCNTCDASIGDYVAVATTDAKGRFTLTDVPATTHVPLVVQTGKWRRETFINTIAPCQDTKVPAANSRLPRNHMEGDMPQMLLLTGGCDDLGCFMRNIGVDASEFSAPHGGGRLDVYQGSGLVGSGAGLSSATAGTWGTPAFTKQAYEYYDIAILSCECAEHNEPAAGGRPSTTGSARAARCSPATTNTPGSPPVRPTSRALPRGSAAPSRWDPETTRWTRRSPRGWFCSSGCRTSVP